IGALGIFWDANFNGVLDEGDVNIVDFIDDDYYYDYYDSPSRNHENEGPGVVVLNDNDPSDMDETVGKYVTYIGDIDIIDVQGATFFFAALDEDLTATQSVSVQPYSSSSIRVTGMANKYIDVDGDGYLDPVPTQGIFLGVDELDSYYYYYYDDYYYYYGEQLALGISGADGMYDIGLSADDISDGDMISLYPFIFDGEQENNGRDLPLVNGQPDEYGNSYFGNQGIWTYVEGTVINAQVAISELNTLVQGYALDADGAPVSGYVWAYSEILDSNIEIEKSAEIGEDGYFSFWALNGLEIELVASLDGGPFIQTSFFLNATEFDETLNAYIYTYNLDINYQGETGFIEGYVYQEAYNDFGDLILDPAQNAEVMIYNDEHYFVVYTDEYGYYVAEVPAPGTYYVAASDNIEGYTTYGSYDMVTVYQAGDYVMVYDIYYYMDINYYTISGYVYDQNGQPVYDAYVDVSSFYTDQGDREHDSGYYDYDFTDTDGSYSIVVPEGLYDMSASYPGFFNSWIYGVDVGSDIAVNFTLTPIGGFTGSVQGVISYIGEYDPDGSAYINVWNDTYDVTTYANEDGFYSVDLIDGVYNIYVSASGYDSYYMEDAFEISGNTVTYDVELFEYGFAAPPQMVDLHDVPNDQGRQMRAVWHAGMPGDWGYFTQFSIWRKVNNAPIELWDYIETVPWHGMDPYAAVVPTLGDSSMHGMHMSTFMITAHTEDVSVWLDSEPMSGYSIDNLHPGAPMSLSFSTSPGSVSLNWSGPVDEDFSYFNIYRQDILTNEPAMVFTTSDSFYVDQELSDVGAYEYWVTAVDMSGLESDASSIVSAVLSAEEDMGMPTEFALKQNYPNPFNPSTQIQYSLPSESRVVISIYDLTGRKIRTLVNEVQSAGHRSVMWNATNEIGRPVSAGMYIYTIQAGDFIQNRKMVLMK
ncbi:MAG: carboxypeptidase regulatory-like domain-containing protein, partial [bacterium]